MVPIAIRLASHLVPGACLVLLLAACSGGGGGSSNPGMGGSGSTLALFAGEASVGANLDGTGTAARFLGPRGIAADGTGTLYVADTENFTIRKITPGGAVTTIAGAPRERGFADGTGSAARFQNPVGIAVDASGNVFVADMSNHSIRKVAPSGTVTTVAGNGQPGSDDGTGAAARFVTPEGVAVDRAGNLYVSDTGNFTIRKITVAGVVTTVAGAPGQGGSTDGPASQARFLAPRGLAVDSSGNVLIADSSNTIRKLIPDELIPGGVVVTFSGLAGAIGAADGLGANASFNRPQDVAVDGAGNIYVADTGNHRIRKITSAGIVSTVPSEPIASPRSLAVVPDGRIYVADDATSRIVVIAPSGAVSTFAGGDPSLLLDGLGINARFNGADQIAADGAGNLYVVDKENSAVRKIAPSGQVTTLTRGLGTISGIAADSVGNAYVGQYLPCAGRFGCPPDYGGHILRIAPAGEITPLAVNEDGVPKVGLGSPRAIARDSAGNLYFTVFAPSGVFKLTPDSALTLVAGEGAGMLYPAGIAVDASGQIYVSDNVNRMVRKISPAGVVTILAVLPAQATIAASDLWFASNGLALDAAGNVYMADSLAHVVRKITPAGAVSTIAGRAGERGFVAGPLPGLLDSPRGVAVVGNDLYITVPTGVAVVHGLP